MRKQLQHHANNEQLSSLKGEFINTELENNFIQSHWSDKARQIRIVLIISFFAYLFASFQNYLDLQNSEHFYSILLARFIQFGFFAWSIYVCSVASNITKAQIIIFITEIITAIAEVIETLAYNQAENFDINLISAPFLFFIILIYYAFIPIRWSLTTIASLVGGTLIILAYLYIAEDHLESIIRHPVMLLGVIAIGAGVVRSMNIAQRQNWLQSKKLQNEIIERRRAEKRASQASKAKSEFLAVMSHEIRTPLNSILAMSEILSTDNELQNESSQRQLHILNIAGNHLSDIIGDVLDFSSIESRVISLSIKPIDLLETVEYAKSSIVNLAQQKNLQLNVEIGLDVPKFVLGDEQRIRQILINLIGNAIKFTEQGSINVSINRIKTLNNGILFSVKDTGIGIPETDLSKIFEPFQQSNFSSTRPHPGTGLGLAISSELVKQMNGQISARNNPNGGAIFEVIIPLEKTETPAEQFSHQAFKETNLEFNALIIEDSELNQIVFKEFLKQHDCTLDFYDNGLKALEALKSKDYDIILMDLHMPYIDGITVTEMIRNWEQENTLPSLPIIMISADNTVSNIEKAKKAGVNQYLNKPISRSILFSALIEHIPHSMVTTEEDSSESPLNVLLPKFFKLTTQHIEELHKEIDNSNQSRFITLTHTMKGHCQIFGFYELAESISELQDYIENSKTISNKQLHIKLNKFENRFTSLKSQQNTFFQ